jgi:hypothetical protein
MKKNIKTAILAALSFVFWTACTEEHTIVLEPSDFDVKTAASTYKVGETVQFDLAGNPDVITFYSGELGSKYENRMRTQLAGAPKLLFQAQMQQGKFSNGDTLQLLVASNVKSADSASLIGATWTDITNRNTKWAKTMSTTFVASDTIDLADFNTAESVSLAFKVIGKKDTSVAQRKWSIQNLVVNNNLPDGTVTPVVSTFANAGWIQLSTKNFAYAWDVGTPNVSGVTALKNTSGGTIRTAYPITFEPSTTKGTDDNEDWLISSPINLKTVKADAGFVVKNTTSAPQTNYKYVFKKAGVYTVNFVGLNANITDKKEVVKQIQVTIQ